MNPFQAFHLSINNKSMSHCEFPHNYTKAWTKGNVLHFVLHYRPLLHKENSTLLVLSKKRLEWSLLHQQLYSWGTCRPYPLLLQREDLVYFFLYPSISWVEWWVYAVSEYCMVLWTSPTGRNGWTKVVYINCYFWKTFLITYFSSKMWLESN